MAECNHTRGGKSADGHQVCIKCGARILTEAEILLHEIGNAVLNISDKLQDEGDRVYLESTNDKDMMISLGQKYWAWRLGEMS